MSEETIRKLCAHLDVLLIERQMTGDEWEENDLFFPSLKGTPWDSGKLYRNFKKYLKQAVLPDIRFHDLRHTVSTLMLQQNINPKIVQERLGHADITMTLNMYPHVLPSMQESAAEKLDELLIPIEVGNELKEIEELQNTDDSESQ